MPRGIAPRELVRPGREQEVAGHRAQLRTVGVALAVHGKRFVASLLVEPVADMTDRISLLVAPRRKIAPHQLRIDARAIDLRHVVRFDHQPNLRFQIPLEREVHVAAVEHQRPVHGPSLRKTDDDATRPMRERPRAIRPAPHADRRSPAEIDG